MQFQVGDRVEDSMGTSGRIIRYTNDRDFVIEQDNDKGEWYCSAKDWEKIGGSMNQYDDLKQRIEKVTAWDKEADDILQEMKVNYAIAIPAEQQGKISIYNPIITPHSNNNTGKIVKRLVIAQFHFLTQCEKLEAFKKALMWLLDHSDIKKDEKKEKIKELEEKLKEIQQELKELK